MCISSSVASRKSAKQDNLSAAKKGSLYRKLTSALKKSSYHEASSCLVRRAEEDDEEDPRPRLLRWYPILEDLTAANLSRLAAAAALLGSARTDALRTPQWA
jgi:hypothetical protein